MATRKKSGLSATTLQRPAARPRNGGPAAAGPASLVSTLRGVAGSDSSGITLVSLADVAGNPDNPVGRGEEVDALAGSVRQVGVLQPLTLAPAAVFVGVNPHHRVAVGEAVWVVLDGHRRRAAAALAGLESVPAVVREDLAAERSAEVILHANLHALELMPLEEARAYQRVIDQQGLSQRALSEHTGVSQAQISKRLSLLGLPASVQAGIETGWVPVIEALTLLKEPEDVQARVGRMYESGPGDLTVLTREATRLIAAEAAADAARAAARETGAQFVADAHERLGPNTWDHELRTAKDIAAAQARDDLLVAPATPYGDGKPRYYRASKPAQSAGTAHEAAEREAKRHRTAAIKARTAALAQVVPSPPAPAVMSEAVTRFVLLGHSVSADLARVAIPLTAAAGLTTTTAVTDWWTWREELAALPGRAGLHAAWILALAAQEYTARSTYTQWGPPTAAYLEFLTAHGYTPTPWEQQLLASIQHTESDPAGADASHDPVAAAGDSSGITGGLAGDPSGISPVGAATDPARPGPARGRWHE